MTRSFVWPLALLLACGDSDEFEPPPGGSLSVTQAGAQDIEEFRRMLRGGEIPPVESFDQLGFFAEHAIDQPEADCGFTVCVHPQLAVAPRFDDGNWTMAFASFNTAVTAESRERDAVHLAVVVDISVYTDRVREELVDGIEGLVGALEPEDRVTLIVYGDGAEVVRDGAAPTEVVPGELPALQAVEEGSALYDGLALAVDRLVQDEAALAGGRILLVGAARAVTGITDRERIVALGAAAAQEGIGMSIVGVGNDYEPDIARALAEQGTATLASAHGDEIPGVIAAQAELSLVPLATDMELRIRPAPGYAAGAVHGVRDAAGGGAGVVLRIPGLFLGARTGGDDVDEMVGRRGGGGGVFVRLWPQADAAERIGPGAPAFTAEVSYTDHDSGERVEYEVGVDNGLAPGENPDEFWPHFSDEAHAKPFMMLNMWLAVDYALRLHRDGHCEQAMGVAEMMEQSVEVWQDAYDDADIEADAELLFLLRAVIAEGCTAMPVPPTFVDAGCFGT
ncbi:MAG: hypothetical protein OXT09_30570 [Myxococcales bacterium]|nr:hypothetical protein [Myxococcales bacterium]